MNISLQEIQDLAPDQASLTAAKKLLKPAKWPMRGQDPNSHTICGQCQGSGANPYYTMADVLDHGYKCTCPSRKFPCKHVLALLWQFADGPDDFVTEVPPEWVNDWLGRRRKSSSSNTSKNSGSHKNIHAADDVPSSITAEEQARREATKARRAEKNRAATDASVSLAMEDLQLWLADQLHIGMASFLKEINERCRQIAARMVDAKAANLASRVDELAAKIYSFPLAQQPQWLLKELGQLFLLSEAWLSDKQDADVRRAIVSAETREQVLNHADSLRKRGLWQVVGERSFTRRDGLISHASWLLNSDEAEPCFALLQDYYPVATGRREVGLSAGRQIEGQMVFYPSRSPLRAVLEDYRVLESVTSAEHREMDPYLAHWQHLRKLPWAELTPCLLGQGRILLDAGQGYWWQDAKQHRQLPLSNQTLNPLLLGSDLFGAVILWDGDQAELLSVQSEHWGYLTC